MRAVSSVLWVVILATTACAGPHITGGPATAQIHLRFGCETLDGTGIPGCTEHTEVLFGGDSIAAPPMRCMQDNVDEPARRVKLTLDLSNTVSGVVEGLTLSAVDIALDRRDNHGAPVGPCTLTFHDGEAYTAACGASPPSAEQPCQLAVVLAGPTSDINTGYVFLRCVDVRSTTSDSRRSVAGVTSWSPMDPPEFLPEDPPGTGQFWDCPVTRYY